MTFSPPPKLPSEMRIDKLEKQVAELTLKLQILERAVANGPYQNEIPQWSGPTWVWRSTPNGWVKT